MKISIRKGLGFGLTSGIITTLGIIVGLNSGTHSKSIIISGILTIAIADSLSDALGIHISEESGSKKITETEVWESTISTFFSKLFFALSFLIPVIFLSLSLAIKISILWGFLLISLFSYYIAKKQNTNPKKAILEHLTITLIVILLTNYVGVIIEKLFL